MGWVSVSVLVIKDGESTRATAMPAVAVAAAVGDPAAGKEDDQERAREEKGEVGKEEESDRVWVRM